MPLDRTIIREDIALAVWKIDEQDEYFLDRLRVTREELERIHQLKARRKTEWLASRWLWDQITANVDHGPIIKDKFGKPYISNSSWHMSISHTHHHAAVITAPFLVGIDVQKPVSKITRIARKFLSEEEMGQVHNDINHLQYLHVYWGAKESLYKAYGRRELDFKNHLRVDPFGINGEQTTGAICKDGIHLTFDIFFKISQRYVLVYAIEKNQDSVSD